MNIILKFKDIPHIFVCNEKGNEFFLENKRYGGIYLNNKFNNTSSPYFDSEKKYFLEFRAVIESFIYE